MPLLMAPTSHLTVSTTSVVDCGGHRISSRSVSWNTTGYYLGFASSDRMARLMTLDNTTSAFREVLVISGHTAPVTKIRFHPHEETTLMTAGRDQSVRLWDCRQATQKSLGSFAISEEVSVEWCGEPSKSHYIVVTERQGQVSVYDRRKLAPNRHSTTGVAVHTFDRIPLVVDKAMFGPHGAETLIGGLTYGGDGPSDLGVWNWLPEEKNKMKTDDESRPLVRYPAHAGPIYVMALSPNGKRIATGGSDALVGLWDTDQMVCTHTVPSPTRLVRSVSFSHDSAILAFSTDENDIFLADALSGASLGSVSLGHRRGGADEVAWHPKAHILACARVDGFGVAPPIAVAKLAVTKTMQ